MSDPINCGKAIRGVIIPTGSSYTGCELSAVNTLNPGCCGFMYHSGVTVVHMINSKVYVNFLVWVKSKWCKLDDFTMILCPGRNVSKSISSFLKRETYSELKALCEFFALLFLKLSELENLYSMV